MSEDANQEEGITLPQLDEIKQEISISDTNTDKAEASFLNEFTAISLRSERSYAHLKGLRDHYWHKTLWSWSIVLIMAFMIVFQSILLWRVGTNVWNFEKYPWLLPALLVQNLAQVIGLALIVVRSLFKDIGSE